MSYLWRQRDMQGAQPCASPLAARGVMTKLVLGAAISALPTPILAEDREAQAAAAVIGSPLSLIPASSTGAERNYGPARPGLGTPASTIDPGHVSIEMALADWQRDVQNGVRADTLLAGDTTVRVGLTQSVEAFVSWTPFGHVRVRDMATGEVDQVNRVGDVSLGFKTNLRSPDGSGFAVAVQPFVALPVGKAPIGAGDWGAGVVMPASYDLSETVNVQLTSEIDAATNSAGHGRHLAYSVVGGVSVKLSKAFQTTAEIAAQHDDDPDEHTTQTFAALSFAWGATDNLQLDVGGSVGLNRQTPDHRLYVGISRRF